MHLIEALRAFMGLGPVGSKTQSKDHTHHHLSKAQYSRVKRDRAANKRAARARRAQRLAAR